MPARTNLQEGSCDAVTDYPAPNYRVILPSSGSRPRVSASPGDVTQRLQDVQDSWRHKPVPWNTASTYIEAKDRQSCSTKTLAAHAGTPLVSA